MLLVIDGTVYQKSVGDKTSPNTFTDFLKEYVEQLKLEESVMTCINIQQMFKCDKVSNEDVAVCLVIFNKLDLIEDLTQINKICSQYPEFVTGISCKNSEHIQPLIEKMKIHLESL